MNSRVLTYFTTNTKPLIFTVRSFSVLGCNNLNIITNNNSKVAFGKHNQSQRNYSIQETIDSIIKTQAGIFKTLSESTPVEYSQKFLITLHESSGLPWWATIVISTILVRTCVTLPLAVYQNYILAKVENLNREMVNIVKELKGEMSVAIRKFKWDEKTAKYYYKRSLKKQWNQLVVRDNCHPFKAGLLLWFQIPLWVCFSVSLRNLVYMLPVPDLQAQIIYLELSGCNFAWISSLVQADGTLILPLTLGIINLLIIELQVLTKVNVPSKTQKIFTNIFRGFSVIMIPVAASVPSCLALYWTTSSLYGLGQNLVLMSPSFRRACGIPKAPSEQEQPYKQVLEKIKYKFNVFNNTKEI